MKPGVLDLVCPAGATFTKTFTWKIDGQAQNLTNYTARMQVRKGYAGSDLLVSLTSSSGITLGGTAGTIAVFIADSATSNLPSGVWRYDLEMVSGDATPIVTRLLEGKFTVTPEVTK